MKFMDAQDSNRPIRRPGRSWHKYRPYDTIMVTEVFCDDWEIQPEERSLAVLGVE